MIYLSFILPSYNVSQYLPEALEAIIKLPQDEVEAIIVNDGSKDNTLDVARSFEGKIKNLRIIDQANQGVCSARNNGLNAATGKYIIFFDADDVIVYDEFIKSFELLKSSELDILIGNGYYYIDGKIQDPFSKDNFKKNLGVVSGPQYYLETSKRKEYNQYSELFLIKREFLLTNNIRYTLGIVHEDKEFAAKCFSRAKSVLYTGHHYVLYRQHSSSLSNVKGRQYSPSGIEAYRIVISNLAELYRKSNDSEEKRVLDQTIAECFVIIYRRIPSMRKKKVPEVKNYTWNYINALGAFELLSFKNKMFVLGRRFKAFIRTSPLIPLF